MQLQLTSLEEGPAEVLLFQKYTPESSPSFQGYDFWRNFLPSLEIISYCWMQYNKFSYAVDHTFLWMISTATVKPLKLPQIANFQIPLPHRGDLVYGWSLRSRPEILNCFDFHWGYFKKYHICVNFSSMVYKG